MPDGQVGNLCISGEFESYTLEVIRCLGMHLLAVEESVFMKFIPEKNIRRYIEVTGVVLLLMNQGNPVGLGLANGPNLNLPALKPDGA